MVHHACARPQRKESSSVHVNLQNRIAREILDRLLAYSREFGHQTTQVGQDDLCISTEEFAAIVDRMAEIDLVTRTGGACVATANGLSVAAQPTAVASLFPVDGGAHDTLPWEADYEGRPFAGVSNPPPAMNWDEYCAHIRRVWPALLTSDRQGDEAPFQRFLEKHPCLLPDPYACFQRGATRYTGGVFTQPELPGFRAKRPDFMVMTYDSEAVVVLLVEIEAPAKTWSTKAGTSTAELTQARDQLLQWKAWFREPENVIQFCKLYRIDQRTLETRQLMPRYVLIYGRRAEVESKPAFAKKRADIAAHDEVLMTYDRLAPSPRLAELPMLRLNRSDVDTKIEVVSVPPTLHLCPQTAREFASWASLRDAVRDNALITTERKQFLLDRLDYWDEWIRKPPNRRAQRPRLDDGYRE